MQGRSQQLLVDIVFEKTISANDLEKLIFLIQKHFGTLVNKHEIIHENINSVTCFTKSEKIILDYELDSKLLYLRVEASEMSVHQDDFLEELSTWKVVAIKIKNHKRVVLGQHFSDKKLKFIFFMATFTATCSMLYELLLAQSLSSVMGNTALRYSTTIGLYIASMGIGALFYGRFFKKSAFNNFVKVEMLLSFVGVVAPILVLIFDFLFRYFANQVNISFLTNSIQIPFSVVCHLLVVIIGILSGVELPLFIEMGRELGHKAENKILAFDYLGTLLGAILFPILILPYFNIFTIGYLVSFGNLILAFCVARYFKIQMGFFKYLLIFMLILWPIIILSSSKLNEFIVKVFYLGGL